MAPHARIVTRNSEPWQGGGLDCCLSESLSSCFSRPGLSGRMRIEPLLVWHGTGITLLDTLNEGGQNSGIASSSYQYCVKSTSPTTAVRRK